MEERREVRVQTRDGREEGGEENRRGMEERREVRVQTRDGRDDGAQMSYGLMIETNFDLEISRIVGGKCRWQT